MKRPLSSDELQQQTIETKGDDLYSRYWRTSLLCVMPLMLFPLYLSSPLSLNASIGLIVVSQFTAYFVTLAGKVVRAPYLWRIESKSGTIPHWAPMTVTYKIKHHRLTSIQSVSEFSAIRGASANVALVILSNFTYALVMMVVLLEFHEAQDNNREVCPGAYPAMLGTFGLSLIGIWDLKPESRIHRFWHYLGVFLGIGCLVAYTTRKPVTAWPYLLDIGFVVAYFVWMYRIRVSEQFSATLTEASFTDEQKLIVTRNSVWCLASESSAIIIASTSLAMWVIFTEDFEGTEILTFN
jgi:hypothetical protein